MGEGKGDQCIGLKTLPPHLSIDVKYGILTLLEPSGPVQDCTGIAFLFCAPLYGISNCGLVYYNALEGSNTSGYRVFYCALED
jgi:hypothetical protein